MRNNNKEHDLDNEVISGLETTVEGFAARLQQKLTQKALAEDDQLVRQKARQSVVLHGLKTIRRAFQDTCRIALGDRFSLGLKVDDFEGWPRLRLMLIDKFAPANIEYVLAVTAFNRPERAGIEFRDVSNKAIGRILLEDDNKLDRLPAVLKKQVREYLDKVAEYVLNPRPVSDVVTEGVPTEKIEERPEDKLLAAENLFMEESLLQNNNVVTPNEPQGKIMEESFHMTEAVQIQNNNVITPETASEAAESAEERRVSKLNKPFDPAALDDLTFD